MTEMTLSLLANLISTFNDKTAQPRPFLAARIILKSLAKVVNKRELIYCVERYH